LTSVHVKSIDYLKKKKKSVLLNCGYGKGYSVQDIANIFKKTRKNISINYQKRRPGDIAQVYANTKKFKKILKWRPKYNSIKKILSSSIQWEKIIQN